MTSRSNTPYTTTIISTTTTTTTTRGAGVGGSPPADLERRVSPATAYMLLLLAAEGPLDYTTLSSRMGVAPSDVRARARYWMRKGWLSKNSPFVKLTELGEELVSKYAEYLARIASSRYNDTSLLLQTIIERRVNFRKLRLNEGKTRVKKGKLEQNEGKSRVNKGKEEQTLAKRGEERVNERLAEEELRILSALVELCRSGGRGYAYVDQLAELTGLSEDDVLRYSRWLQSRGLVYLYRDRRLGWRVGIRRELRDELCGER